MRIHYEDDLRVVTFRQSWTDTAQMCLDRARRDGHRDRSLDTEATALGTSLHAGMAAALAGELDNPKGILDLAVETFDGIEKTYVDDDRDGCIRWLKQWTGMLREVPDFMEAYRASDAMIETTFDIRVDVRQEEGESSLAQSWTEMRWSGTWDLLLPHKHMKDWKTAGRAYQAWERQRWAVQPTFYTEAARQMGLLPEESEFRYVVFQKRKDKPVQVVPVYRTVAFTDHMVATLWRIVDLHDALPNGPWPINDQHALCSEKFCPYWGECKGRYVPVDFGKR